MSKEKYWKRLSLVSAHKDSQWIPLVGSFKNHEVDIVLDVIREKGLEADPRLVSEKLKNQIYLGIGGELASGPYSTRTMRNQMCERRLYPPTKVVCSISINS